MREYAKTGIRGLDSILSGGISRRSTVLVSGNPGTGKSILAMQYLYNGVREFDENGIYLSFEEDTDDLVEAAESIGFEDWSDMVEKGSIKIYDKTDVLRDEDFSSTLTRLIEETDTERYERLVMDSITMFEMFFDDEKEKRTYLLKFADILKQKGLTSLLTHESESIFPDREIGFESFLTDGNIYMIQTPTSSGVNRYIWVAKMRKQNINSDIFPIEIGKGGITVHEDAAGFSLMGNEYIDR
ncbi:MAG: ATPase domain-containing protein [Halobacteria archaeon]|nr:ATPase domain-containing protein [Halobacteria archaeon]